MAHYIVSDTGLTSIANAIRTRGGTSAALAYPDGFTSAIDAIPSGGGADLSGLDVYIADYLVDPPTITTGALNTLERRIYGQ